MPKPPLAQLLTALPALCLCALAGCSQGFYKRSADREVFGIIGQKSGTVPGADDMLLNITPPPPVKLDALLKKSTGSDFLGERAFVEKDARVLTLADALDFAIHRNRTYLSRKELVYLSALGLTLTRQQFSPVADGGGGVFYTERQVQGGVNNLVRTSTLTTDGAVGLNYLMRTGARLAMDLSTDFTRFFTGDNRRLSESRAAATLSQPLLRGAGVLAASEPLRQDERNVLYAIRDFTQYRKEFAVDITRQYLRVLQAREAARNRDTAYRAAILSLEREKALADANLRSQSSLKQIEQGLLSYERARITAIRVYEDQLDDLKVTLGLPVTERIVLDNGELDRLEIHDPKGNLEDAVDTALVTRLDLFNQRDRLQDAARKVKIAHQQTLPGVNALVGYQMNTPPNTDGLQLDASNRRFTTGLDVDLNLNTKPERNVLRATQVAEQRAERDLELAEEQLRNAIRSDWRNLHVAHKQFLLAQDGLVLAQKRLEIEEALMAEGQGTARDIVESQDRLITARDFFISTRIDHVLARLQLWSDMGILFLEKDRRWADVLNKEKPKGQTEE
jgi:outer membrane protein TolC